MKVNYFEDTDTLFIELTEATAATTRDVGENLTVDLDARGQVVSLTVEHARANGKKPDFPYELIGK